jgi:hypothetical protein
MQFIKKLDKKDKHGRYIYIFKCLKCNNLIEINLSNGRRNKTCGCELLNHSNIKSKRLYECWVNMFTRCTNKNNEKYKRYGGRGILICKEWSNYLIFQKWALCNGYKNNLQIDRKNNNGNYEPSNCRWVTLKENIRNSSISKLNIDKVVKIRELNNIGKNALDLSKKFNMSRTQIYNILSGRQWIIDNIFKSEVLR